MKEKSDDIAGWYEYSTVHRYRMHIRATQVLSLCRFFTGLHTGKVGYFNHGLMIV
jgi:hypothetical protein